MAWESCLLPIENVEDAQPLYLMNRHLLTSECSSTPSFTRAPSPCSSLEDDDHHSPPSAPSDVNQGDPAPSAFETIACGFNPNHNQNKKFQLRGSTVSARFNATEAQRKSASKAHVAQDMDDLEHTVRKPFTFGFSSLLC